jgi:hypothetical protein
MMLVGASNTWFDGWFEPSFAASRRCCARFWSLPAKVFSICLSDRITIAVTPSRKLADRPVHAGISVRVEPSPHSADLRLLQAILNHLRWRQIIDAITFLQVLVAPLPQEGNNNSNNSIMTNNPRVKWNYHFISQSDYSHSGRTTPGMAPPAAHENARHDKRENSTY